MTTLVKAGDAIRAPKVFYFFGSVPNSATLVDGRYTGTFSRNGYAREDRPLQRNHKGKRVPLKEIRCKSARFECDDKPNLPGKKEKVSGSHRGFSGKLTGDALVTIKIPLPHHA